jgi:acyl-CoA dehydrogenase
MDRDTRDMLLETADRFFTQRCGREVVNGVEKGAWPADLWKEIEEMGLPLIAVPEDKGGVGGTLGDMLALLRLAGSHAVPVPLAETALGNLLIAAAGGEPKPGPVTLALGNLQLSAARSSAFPSLRLPTASSRWSVARWPLSPRPMPRLRPSPATPASPTAR